MSRSPAQGKNDRGKRRIFSGKCLIAVLMVAVMAVSCFVLINDSDDSSAAATEVSLLSYYQSDMVTLTNGQSAYGGDELWSASFTAGKLTIEDNRVDSEGIRTYQGQHNFTANKYAMIYANGDLTIEFRGNNPVLNFTRGQVNAAEMYGIYVTGNLTIINDSTVDRTVQFDTWYAYDNYAYRGANSLSAGIYCSGKLTVINNSDRTFDLCAKGSSQSYNDGSDRSSYATYGILCGSASFNKIDSTVSNHPLNVTAIGGNITHAPKGGTVESIGIRTNNGGIDIEGNTSMTYGDEAGAVGGSINISGYTNSMDVISAGIYSASALTYAPTNGSCLVKATGGDIFMESNTSTYGKGGISYGIYAGSMSAGGTITATGGTVPLGLPATTSNSYGIWTTSFTGDHATITATASDATRVSCGFFSYGGFDTGEGSTITCTGGAAPSNLAGTYSAGLDCLDYIGRNGSDVTGTSGIVCYDETAMTAGVKVSTILLNGNAKLTGNGGDTCLTFTPTQYANSSNRVSTGASADSTYGIYVTGDSVAINGTSMLTGTAGNINSGESDPNEVVAGVFFEYSTQSSTISGTGSVRAYGGTVTYSTSSREWNVSAGIYASRALIIDGTHITAEGGTVCTADDASEAYRGSRSYGLYAKSLSILGGSEVSAEGGANGCYRTSSGSDPKYNDSIGIYVTDGNLSVSGGSSLTATGKDSQRIIGIIVNGNVSVEGASTITVNVPTYEPLGYVGNLDGIGKASIGIYLSNDTSSFNVPSGTVILAGTTQAIRCTAGNTGTFSGVEALWTSDSLTGVGAEIISSSTNIANVDAVYVKMDNTFSVVFGGDWVYGDEPSVLEISNPGRVVSKIYTGTDVFGSSYYSDTTPPTDAGDYTLTVTYDGDNVK